MSESGEFATCDVHAEARPLPVHADIPFRGIYRDSSGTVYLTTRNKRAPVISLSPGTSITQNVARTRLDLFTDPIAIAGNHHLGHVYVANAQGVPVVKVSQEGIEELVKKGKDLFSSPIAITVNHRTGVVYVVNRVAAVPFYHPVLQIDSTGYAKTAVGRTAADFSDPRGIACDTRTGDLFITNSYGPMPVIKVEAGTGDTLSFVQHGMHLFNSPTSIAIDPVRNLYVINQGGATPLVKIDQQGRAGRVLVRGRTLSSPLSLALGHFDLLTRHYNFLITTNTKQTPLVKVFFAGKPLAPTNVSARPLSCTSAEISWAVPASCNSRINRYIVRSSGISSSDAGSQASHTMVVPGPHDISGTRMSCVMHSLTAATSYSFEIVAVNEFGASQRSLLSPNVDIMDRSDDCRVSFASARTIIGYFMGFLFCVPILLAFANFVRKCCCVQKSKSDYADMARKQREHATEMTAYQVESYETQPVFHAEYGVEEDDDEL